MGLWVVSKKKFDVAKLRFLLQNTLSKKIIKSAVIKESDGRTRLEHALDKYIENENLSLKEKVKFFPIKKVLDIVRRSFSQDEEKFKEYLKESAIRKILLNSFLSLNKYGLNTPQNFVAPVMVVWNITYKCNLRCKHCYQNAILGKGAPDELTLEEKYKVLDKLAEENIPSIFFSGGEPLIHPDFWKTAEYAKKKGFYISIATNGTLWDKKNAKKAKDLGVGYVAVSLDGASPKVHDKFRGVPGMWKKAVQGIKNLIQAGVTACIQFTLTKDTIKELPKMFKLLKKLGAYKLIVYNYIPVGRGDFKNDPTPEEREEAWQIMYEQLRDSTTKQHIIATTAPQFGRYCKEAKSDNIIISHYAEAKAKELGVIADIVGGCGAGRAYCALQPNGDLTPCVFIPKYIVGNLKRQPFQKIWNDPRMAQFRTRDDLKGNCGKCEYKELCGGCRARAYAYFKDFKAPDPGCIKNKEEYYKLKSQLKI